MKKLLFMLLLAGCASGQVHVENDYFGYLNKNEDKYFTNGAKFSSFHTKGNERDTYSLGQNIYTPSKKKADATPEQLKDNRPYAGWLYLEYRNAVLKDDVKTVWGVQAGCTGECSLAKQTQIGVHKLLGQKYPTWDNDYALKTEPGIILEGEKYYGLARARQFTSNYFVRAKLGNIIDSGSLGLNFFYGEGVEEFYPEAITFKGKKAPWSYYLFGDIEGRVVPYNYFLQGSLFQEENHTVDPNLFVGQAELGVRVGYENLKFSYSYTAITDEWQGQNGPFFFGGVDISW